MRPEMRHTLAQQAKEVRFDEANAISKEAAWIHAPGLDPGQVAQKMGFKFDEFDEANAVGESADGDEKEEDYGRFWEKDLDEGGVRHGQAQPEEDLFGGVHKSKE